MTEAIGLNAILNTVNFDKGLASYQKGLSQMTSSTDRAAGVLSSLGNVAQGALVAGLGVATAAFAGIVAASKVGLDATLAWAEQLDKLSDQFGFSGQQASSWAFLMNRVGLSVDEGGQGLNYFTNQLGSFGKTMKDGTLQVTPFSTALQKLGVSAIDLATGKLKTFDQVMPEIMDKFKELPAGVDASALAMDLFGTRGGTKFLDFLRQGSKGLDDATKKAKEFGLDLSTDEVNAAEEFGFKLNELNLEFTGLKNIIGRAVLPIVTQLVDYISWHVIPRLIDLAKRYLPPLIDAFRSLADWVQRNVLPVLQQFTDWITTTAIPMIQAFAQGFQPLFDILARVQLAIPDLMAIIQEQNWGDLSDFVWEWVAEVRDDIGNKLSEITTAISQWIDQNGPLIGTAFLQFGRDFWAWVTAPGGVVATTAGNLINVVYAIRDWLMNPANTQPMWDFIGLWAGKFWGWITDTTGGVLIYVTEKMGLLATAIETWANDPKTQKRFGEIGTDLARYIMDGMGDLFSDKKEGDSLMNKLWRTLLDADRRIAGAMMGIGRDISISILSGLASIFTDPATAQNFALNVTSMITNAMNYVISQIPFILAPFTAAWNAAIGLITGGTPQTPEPPGYPPGGIILPPFQHGGYVPRTMPALLHAGEYVIPARQVSNVVHNTRTIGENAIVINFPSTGGLSQKSIRDTVYVAVREVLDAA